jgi:outer membrane lipoprotein SlyB
MKREQVNLFHPQVSAALAALISLAACVPPPVAPTIPVAPGPNKTFDAFGADQAACQQYAAVQISAAVATANNQAVGGALLGAALGAGLGAGIGAAAGHAGKGAAVGAASGGALGIIVNPIGAPSQESLQQQYDVMYGQCMAAHGNSVVSLSPPPGLPPS